MSQLTLILGSRNYSSWSLRPWLFLRHHGVAFKEVVIPLNQADSKARILQHSPSGKVPMLKDGTVQVWESLAICEYAAEALKLPHAWPAETVARALARSVATEMHAGFSDLRKEYPLDCRRKPAPQPGSEQATVDIKRIRAIWRESRQKYGKGGEWLFGKFGIVDAMYAPVALRFHLYAVPLEGPERDYVQAVLAHPALREWLGAALLEPEPAQAAETLLQPQPTPAAAPKPAQKIEPKPAPKLEPKPELRPEPKPELKVAPKAEPKPEPKPVKVAAPPAPAAPLAPAPAPPAVPAQPMSGTKVEGGVTIKSFIIPE